MGGDDVVEDVASGQEVVTPPQVSYQESPGVAHVLGQAGQQDPELRGACVNSRQPR